jgi:hypothetical protein
MIDTAALCRGFWIAEVRINLSIKKVVSWDEDSFDGREELGFRIPSASDVR